MRNLIIMILTIFMTFGFVAAAGVSASYWDTQGNENPLYLSPGESAQVSYDFFNDNGNDNYVFRATQLSGQEIASVLNYQEEYIVAPGEKSNKMLLDVSLPSEARIGDSYKVSFRFEYNPENSQDQFERSQIRSFDVVVQEKVVQAPNEVGEVNTSVKEGNQFWIYVLLILILLILVVIVIKVSNRKRR
jgi:hypothetical protein